MSLKKPLNLSLIFLACLVLIQVVTAGPFTNEDDHFGAKDFPLDRCGKVHPDKEHRTVNNTAHKLIGNNTHSVRYNATFNDNVILLDKSTNCIKNVQCDGAKVTIVFVAPNTQSWLNWAEGDIIFSRVYRCNNSDDKPISLRRSIVSLSWSGSTLTLTTKRANLTHLFDHNSIKISVPPPTNFFQNVSRTPPSPSSNSTQQKRSIWGDIEGGLESAGNAIVGGVESMASTVASGWNDVESAGAKALEAVLNVLGGTYSGSDDMSLNWPFNLNSSGNGGVPFTIFKGQDNFGGVELTGSIVCTNCFASIGVGLELGVTLSLLHGVSDFSVEVTGDLVVNIDVTASATASWEKELSAEIFSLELGENSWTIDIAGVPIYFSITPSLVLEAVATLDLEASATVSAGYMFGIQVGIGFQYNGGSWSPIDSASFVSNSLPVTYSLNGDASLQLDLKPGIQIEAAIDEILTSPVTFSLDPYLLVDLAVGTDSGCSNPTATWWGLYWGLNLEIELGSVEILEQSVTSGTTWSFVLFDQQFVCNGCYGCAGGVPLTTASAGWQSSGVGAPLPYHYYWDRIGGNCLPGGILTGLSFTRGGCGLSTGWNSGILGTMCPNAGDNVEGLILNTQCLPYSFSGTPSWFASGVGAPLPSHYYFDRLGSQCPSGQIATGMKFARGGCGLSTFWGNGNTGPVCGSNPPAGDSTEGLYVYLNCVTIPNLGSSSWVSTGIGAPLSYHYYWDRVGAVCPPNTAVAGVKFARGGCSKGEGFNNGDKSSPICSSPTDATEGQQMYVLCATLPNPNGGVNAEESELVVEDQSPSSPAGLSLGAIIGISVGSAVAFVLIVVVIVVLKRHRMSSEKPGSVASFSLL